MGGEGRCWGGAAHKALRLPLAARLEYRFAVRLFENVLNRADLERSGPGPRIQSLHGALQTRYPFLARIALAVDGPETDCSRLMPAATTRARRWCATRPRWPACVDEEPFVVHGVVSAELHAITPSRTDPWLAELSR